MRQLPTIAITSISGLLLAGGVFLNATFRPPSAVPPTPPGREHVADSSSNPSGAGFGTSTSEEAHIASPNAIAYAFGWVAAPPPPPKSKPPAPSRSESVVDASWIHFVGTISGADGIAYQYFKDEKSGLIIKTAPGRNIGGWRLVEVGPTEDILEHEKQKLKVRLGNR